MGPQIGRHVSVDGFDVIARFINRGIEGERGEVRLRGDECELHGRNDEDVDVFVGFGEDLENGWRERGQPGISTSWSELWVYPIPAALYLVKNLLQYYVFLYVDAPSYQILKNLNIISTGILCKDLLEEDLERGEQWSALILLALGCTIAQLTSGSDQVLSTPFMGLMMAIVMAILSGAAGVYTELIMKKQPRETLNGARTCICTCLGSSLTWWRSFCTITTRCLDGGIFTDTMRSCVR